MKEAGVFGFVALIAGVGAVTNGCGGGANPGPDDTDRLSSALDQVSSSSKADVSEHPHRTKMDTGTGPSAGCGRPAHVMRSNPSSGRFAGHAVHLVPVFWASNVASTTKTSASGSLLTLASSSLMKMLKTEYGYPGQTPLIDAAVTLTMYGFPGVSNVSGVTSSQIANELNWQVTNANGAFHSKSSSDDYLFVLYFPPTITPFYNGIAPCLRVSPFQNNWCAYHGSASGAHLTFAVMPDSSQGACSVSPSSTQGWCATGVTTSSAALTTALSHEVSETLSDPDGASGFRDRNSGDPCSSTGSNEIGDLCGIQAVQIGGGFLTPIWIQPEWSNKGNGCVTAPAALGDLDGDGRSDLVLTGPNNWGTMPVAFSNGDGTYHGVNGGETSGPDRGFASYAPSATYPVAGDFDGNGTGDLALVGGSGWATIPVAFSTAVPGTYWGTNYGETSGDESFPADATNFGAKPVSGDFNGDGRADIALVGGLGPWSTIPVAFSNGDGSFNGVNNPTSGTGTFGANAFSTPVRPVSGDFDCDGLSDIAVISRNVIQVAHNNGDTTFTVVDSNTNFGANFAFASGARSVAGDFNGDCYADIALVGGSGWGSIPIAYGGPNGFTVVTNTAVSNFATYAQQTALTPIAGDFNGDGLSDIALTGGSGWGTMPQALSNGDGSFTVNNGGETSGDTAFASDAVASGAKPVSQ